MILTDFKHKIKACNKEIFVLWMFRMFRGIIISKEKPKKYNQLQV